MGFDDPRNQGLLALAAGLMAPSRGGSFGGAALQGLQGYQQAYGNASQIQGQKDQLDMMRKKYAFEMEGAQAERKKRGEFEKQVRIAAGLDMPEQQQFQTPAPNVDALSGMPAQMGTQPVRAPNIGLGPLNGQPNDPLSALRDRAWKEAFVMNPQAAGQVKAGLSPKERELVSAGDGKFFYKDDPTRLAADFSNEKLTPLQQQMKAAGIDLASPEAQALLRQAVAKATTHPPAASAKVVMGAMETEQAKAYGKGLGGIRESIMTAGLQAPQTIANYQAIGNALDGLGGGNLEGAKTAVASSLESIGIKVDPRLGDKQFAEALGREMAAGMRQTGTGPMTDKDFENFLKRVPDLSKNPEGRKQIIATAIAKAERDRDVMRMATEYAAKNNGNIDDNFLVQVSQFVAKRPVVSAPVKQQSFGAGWSITPIK